jgi:hypothetical protein
MCERFWTLPFGQAVEPPVAASNSLASVGKLMFLGCTAVSTEPRQVLTAQLPALVLDPGARRRGACANASGRSAYAAKKGKLAPKPEKPCNLKLTVSRKSPSIRALVVVYGPRISKRFPSRGYPMQARHSANHPSSDNAARIATYVSFRRAPKRACGNSFRTACQDGRDRKFTSARVRMKVPISSKLLRTRSPPGALEFSLIGSKSSSVI